MAVLAVFTSLMGRSTQHPYDDLALQVVDWHGYPTDVRAMTIGAFTHFKLLKGPRQKPPRKIVRTWDVMMLEEEFAGTQLINRPTRRTKNFDRLVETAAFGLGRVHRDILEVDLEKFAEFIHGSFEGNPPIPIPAPTELLMAHDATGKSDQASCEVAFALIAVTLPITTGGETVIIEVYAVSRSSPMNRARPDVTLAIASKVEVEVIQQPVHSVAS